MNEEQTTEPVVEEQTTQPVEVVEDVSTESKEEVAIPKFGEFLKHAPEGYKDLKTWDKFKDLDIPTALKVVADMDKWTGKRGDIPDEKASPEEWQKFYSKLGVPSDTKGYEYGLNDELKSQLGDKATDFETYLDKAKEVALKNNIPAKSMKGFLDEMLQHEMGLYKQTAEQQAEMQKQGLKMLQKEWGESFDEMKTGIEMLEKKYGISPEDADEIESNPKVLLLLGRLAADLEEKGQVGGAFSSTKMGLQAELEDVEGQIKTLLVETKGDMNDPRLDGLLSRRTRISQKLG